MKEESILSEAHLSSVVESEQSTGVVTGESTGIFASFFDPFIGQRTQFLVGAVLLILIYINICLTSLAWRRYSKTIVSFFEEEKKEKLRKEKEAREGKDD